MKEERVGQLFLAGIGLLGILIVGGLVWAVMAGPSPTSSAGGTVETDLRFSDDGDPAKGPGDAKITVRMFEDFQCPSCHAAEAGIQYAMKTYGDKVRFIWNDFPLTSLHQNALPAANAARCAEEQGKFWEYHDMLYEQQPSWSELPAPTETFVGYAKQLNLDTDAFAACIAEQKGFSKIQNDESEGDANRVTGTPTVFVGQTRFVGSMDQATWDKALGP